MLQRGTPFSGATVGSSKLAEDRSVSARRLAIPGASLEA